MLVAIDFDGTIVEHEYPKIGKPVPNAIEWIRKFQEVKIKIFLWTMRSGEELDEAVKYCKQAGIIFDDVNVNPAQWSWTKSPKCYAKIYIDDAGFGCPLIYPEEGRPYVDWNVVGPAVLELLRK